MSQLRTYQRDVARVISTEIADTQLQPVSLSEAKAYARVDSNIEDTTVGMLITESLKAFEAFTGKLMFRRNVTVIFECEGESLMILPYLPVVEIVSVQKGGEDVEYTLKGDRINISAVGEVEVVYECGLFESQAQNDVKLGCLKFITSNFEDRQDIAAMGITEMPNSSRSHWMRYKNFSL